MADTSPKAAWPKTPDGTTDWQYVFEDPQAGFIPLLSQAQSAEALKMIATVILQKLFTRKNDVDELTLHLARLATMIETGGAVDVLRSKVTGLLREVKEERIEKARVYIERKHAGASIDRRAGLLWKVDKLLEPQVLVPVAMVFVAALSGLVYMLLAQTLGTDTQVADNTTITLGDASNSEEIASLPKPGETPLTEPEKPIIVMFKSVRWPLANQYTSVRPQYYSVVLQVKNWKEKVEICRRLPAVMDRFYSSFSEMMPPTRMPRSEELVALENVIRSSINDLLPGEYVEKAEVARYGTREFRISSRPPYCETPN